MRAWFVSSFAAAALLAAPLAAADEHAVERPAVYSEEQVSDFVDLLLVAADIENQRVADIRAAASRAEAERIHAAAETRLAEVIEASALPLAVFDEMTAGVQTDLRLAMQVYDELESRGEVALLPEPEGAFPAEAEPAYSSYADDPLF